MELTLDFIAKKFEKFNKLYFGGLKTPKFKITNAKTYLGKFHWKGSDYTILISKYWNRSEKDYCNTIIHEMIHQYIRQNGIKDTRPHHGAVFYRIANDINRKGGWHISRTDSIEGVELNEENKNKTTYLMLAFKQDDGRFFLMRVNPDYRRNYEKRMKNNPSFYKFHQWFESNDDKEYSHFPACRGSLRGKFISEEKYAEIFRKNLDEFIEKTYNRTA